MEQMKNIEGDFFIIPNPSMTEAEVSHDGKFPEMWDRFLNRAIDEWKRFGINVSDERKFIEIWASNSQVDNFADHHRKFAEMTGGTKALHKTRDSFPKYFPFSLIKGLKEGQKLTITRDDGLKVTLKADQSNYRYRTFGKFEDVISNY